MQWARYLRTFKLTKPQLLKRVVLKAKKRRLILTSLINQATTKVRQILTFLINQATNKAALMIQTRNLKSMPRLKINRSSRQTKMLHRVMTYLGLILYCSLKVILQQAQNLVLIELIRVKRPQTLFFSQ